MIHGTKRFCAVCTFLSPALRLAQDPTPCETDKAYVGFEVLTAVTMKNYILWDITLCNLVKVDHRFGGTYRL
jgi:hypothetical protein